MNRLSQLRSFHWVGKHSNLVDLVSKFVKVRGGAASLRFIYPGLAPHAIYTPFGGPAGETVVVALAMVPAGDTLSRLRAFILELLPARAPPRKMCHSKLSRPPWLPPSPSKKDLVIVLDFKQGDCGRVDCSLSSEPLSVLNRWQLIRILWPYSCADRAVARTEM